MIEPIKALTQNSSKTVLIVALLSSFATDAPLLATNGYSPAAPQQMQIQMQMDGHAEHRDSAPAKLVQMVRDATRQYVDVNMAMAANYKPAFGCVTGPDHGAMGVHYINGDLVGDGAIDASHPEALIYEPVGTALRLVGVEFIVDAATWLSTHSNTPPTLEGQAFQFVASPNRFGIPAFFELHVWAWRDNPNGAFVDWNTRVTCEGQ